MESKEYLPSDDEVSFLSELQHFENPLSDDLSFLSRQDGCPARDDAGVGLSGATKQRKVVYKVTLQPRLTSESAQGPAIPPQYMELFEKLQPRIIARGLASDSESLLALNRSLRPKSASVAASSNTRHNLSFLSREDGSSETERQTPRRMLGGRRMPREALAVDRGQTASWSVKHRGSLSLPLTPKTSCTSPEVHSQGLKKPSSPRVGITKPEAQASFGDLGGRNTQHRGSTERPYSASRTLTHKLLRTRSYCDNIEDDKARSWAPEHCSPLESSYRNYSQQIFRNARKLQSFSSEEAPETPEFLRQPIGTQPGRSRSSSVDFSGEKRDLGSWSTSANSVFNSPSISCATALSEDEEAVFRNSLLLCDVKRSGSMQGPANTESAAMKSSSQVANDPSYVSRETLVPTSTSRGLNSPLLDSRVTEWSLGSTSETGISPEGDFDSGVAKCSDGPGKSGVTNSWTKTETNPDTDGSNSSSEIEHLFQAIARISGHPETQMKHETSIVLTEKMRPIATQPGRTASNAFTKEVELSSSISCSAETECSESTDESSTNADPGWAPEYHSSSWQEDEEGGTNVVLDHDSATHSEPGSTRSHNSADNGGRIQEAERHEVYIPEMSSKFISKVTVLLRRPRNQRDQPDQQSGTYGMAGCRIKQLPIGQLKPIQEYTL